MKKRLVIILAFLAVISSPVMAFAAETTTPDGIVTAFFKQLESGAFEEAYHTLFAGSDMIKEKQQAMQTSIVQTRAAFALYGKIQGWEKVDEKLFGRSLKKITYLMHTKYPVAWAFYFWKPKDQWQAVSVKFNDNVQTVLE